MDENLRTTREFNFSLLRHLCGGHDTLVEKLRGIANSKNVSDFVLGRRKIADYTARSIEERLKLPEGWLDRDHAAHFNASDDAYALFTLIQSAPPQVREATRTILEHGGVRAVGQRLGDSARLTLVR